ncbi:ACT domain-containing protein [Maribellus sp. YY47]|uniref:ACT domain-containing protein n=1 Tax=Maribellus sp. YY47 TaxID=2929486 RepID=UPI00200066D5|nr:ACT domain-containing protein [Maribellus sp. YY47]MCK3684866.1 ACT domain-containing protein [Maribellus sp. YY47]
MSDKVIRLGGSHLGNSESIVHLTKYLNHFVGRRFIVVSAVPELLEILSANMATVLEKEPDHDALLTQLLSVHRNITQKEASDSYHQLAEQASGLLKGIALIGDYSRALKDQVLSFSEKLTVEIVKTIWPDSQVLLPEQIALQTTSDYGNASFVSVDSVYLKSLPNGNFIIPGTYGIAENKKIARTGKTSADYTAAFLTRELGVERLELWGLDFDFQRADPWIIESPEVIKRLTYSEASELAYFDHYSLHPRTVEPLERTHIPIEVLSAASSEGKVETVINTETFIEDQIVKSVACTDDISLLKLDGPGVGLKPGILARVTTQLNKAGINIKSVITSQTSINFILSEKNGDKALSLVNGMGFSSVTDISVVKDLSLIGIVGHGMQHAYGVSAKIFTAVANNQINVVISGSGASDLVSYLIVSKSDKEKSVREIYSAFFG